jgi:hypothetical protein
MKYILHRSEFEVLIHKHSEVPCVKKFMKRHQVVEVVLDFTRDFDFFVNLRPEVTISEQTSLRDDFKHEFPSILFINFFRVLRVFAEHSHILSAEFVQLRVHVFGIFVSFLHF